MPWSAWSAIKLDDPDVQDFVFRVVIGAIISGLTHMAGYLPTTKPICDRPSIFYGTLHGALVGTCALLVTTEMVPVNWWSRFGAPMSVGYMLYDIMAYCLPKVDVLLTIHHLFVVILVVPPCIPKAAIICAAGDSPEWPLTSAAFMFMMELSVPPLKYRWYLTNTLNRSALRYVTNSLILGATWTLRLAVCVINVYLFWQDGKITRHMERGTADVAAMFIVGHAVMFCMSMYWGYRLIRLGLWKFLVFIPPPVVTAGGRNRICKIKEDRFR